MANSSTDSYDSTLEALKMTSLSLSQGDIDILMGRTSSTHTKEPTLFSIPPSTTGQESLKQAQEKSQYLKKLSSLQDEVEQLTQRNSLLQVKLEAQKQALQNTAGRQNHVNVISEKAHFELDFVKQNLYNLLPTDMQYVQLQSMPDNKRTLFDSVRIRVYEELAHLQKECTELRQTQEIKVSMEKENAELKRKFRQFENDLKERDSLIGHLEQRLSTTTHSLKQKSQSLLDMQQDPAAERVTEERLKKVEETVQHAETQLSSAEGETEILRRARHEFDKSRGDLLRQLDIMKLDKTYLTKEVTVLTERCAKLEHSLAERTQDLQTLKESHVEQIQEAIEKHEARRGEYQMKLQEEITLIRQRTAGDLDEIKRNAREVYERQIQTLKENLSRVREDLRETSMALETLRRSYADLQTRSQAEKHRIDADITSLSQQLKQKTFEADRLKMMYEDSLAALNKAQLEAEKQGKKCDLLQREMQAVQTTSLIRESELELKATERLQKMMMAGWVDENTYKPSSNNNRQMMSSKSSLMAVNSMTALNGGDKYRQLEMKCLRLTEERNTLLKDLKTLQQNHENMLKIRGMLKDLIDSPTSSHVNADKVSKSLLSIKQTTAKLGSKQNSKSSSLGSSTFNSRNKLTESAASINTLTKKKPSPLSQQIRRQIP